MYSILCYDVELTSKMISMFRLTIIFSCFFIYLNRAVQEGSLLIDSSTISPSVAREVASEAMKKNATYLDAPVSGGIDFWSYNMSHVF